MSVESSDKRTLEGSGSKFVSGRDNVLSCLCTEGIDQMIIGFRSDAQGIGETDG
jgi:hypothetical protein